MHFCSNCRGVRGTILFHGSIYLISNQTNLPPRLARIPKHLGSPLLDPLLVDTDYTWQDASRASRDRSCKSLTKSTTRVVGLGTPLRAEIFDFRFAKYYRFDRVL